jgi:hypothetical protein
VGGNTPRRTRHHARLRGRGRRDPCRDAPPDLDAPPHTPSTGRRHIHLDLQAASRTCFVNPANRPPGPTRSTPSARAHSTSCSANDRSGRLASSFSRRGCATVTSWSVTVCPSRERTAHRVRPDQLHRGSDSPMLGSARRSRARREGLLGHTDRMLRWRRWSPSSSGFVGYWGLLGGCGPGCCGVHGDKARNGDGPCARRVRCWRREGGRGSAPAR